MMRLVVANLNYSSWSMRAWLALRHAQLEFKLHDVGLKTKEGWKENILQFSGAGQGPILVDGSLSIHESLAICEYAAELAPAAKLWPEARALRARGRAISCEMHSGFSALRGQMPCNIRGRAKATPSSPRLEADIARIVDIWSASLSSGDGPFLLGEFSIADCMFFPVAARFRTYGVALPEALAAYRDRLFGLPIVQELEQLGRELPPIAEYDAALDGAV